MKGVRDEMVCNSNWGTRLGFGENGGEDEDEGEDGGDVVDEAAI